MAYSIDMFIEIDIDSPNPVYEQIVQEVIQGVLSGALMPGDNMPSIRQLASDLELNHNTVAKAYKQLESQHVIVTAGRKGTFVHERAATFISENNNQDAQFQLDELVMSFKSKGMNETNISELLTTQLNKIRE